MLLAAGDIDNTFGFGGYTFTDLQQSQIAYDVAVQQDGKIVAVGGAQSSTQTPSDDFIIARYEANGDPDTTFGNGGFVKVDLKVGGVSQPDYAEAVAIQDNGQIVVAGFSLVAGNPSFSVIRLKQDGSLDSGFGQGGQAILGVQEDINGFAYDLLIQPSGRIVIAGGVSPIGSQADFGLVRLTPSGLLDASFGAAGNGWVITNIGTSRGVTSIAQDPTDGSIVAAGPGEFSGPDFVVTKYSAEGIGLPFFGGFGASVVDFEDVSPREVDVAIQPDQRIVLAGGSGPSVGVARLESGGFLDSSFDGDGKQTTSFSSFGESLSRYLQVQLQPDGKIIAGGAAGSSAIDATLILARYNPDGSLDPTFGASGLVARQGGPPALPGSSLNRPATGMALQSNGRIVTSGGFSDPPAGGGFGLVRFLGDGSLFFDVKQNNEFLSVEGSGKPEFVEIFDGGSLGLTVRDSASGNESTYFGVDHIEVNLNGGDDSVTYRFEPPERPTSSSTQPAAPLFNLGGGHDSIVALFPKGIPAVSEDPQPLNFQINGGGGDDVVKVAVGVERPNGTDQTSVDIPLNLDIRTGRGDDVVELSFQQISLQSNTFSSVRTGSGADVVSVSNQGITVAEGMFGTEVTSGSGGDSVTVSNQGIIVVGGLSGTEVTSGSGEDTVTISNQGIIVIDGLVATEVNAGSDADTVRAINSQITSQSDRETSNAIQLTQTINGGSGSDDLLLRLEEVDVDSVFTQSGGSGGDKLEALMFNPQPEPPNPDIFIRQFGGGGADELIYRQAGSWDGALALLQDGGAGEDVLDSVLSAHGRGSINISQYGGRGNDRFKLAMQTRGVLARGFIDGSGGSTPGNPEREFDVAQVLGEVILLGIDEVSGVE